MRILTAFLTVALAIGTLQAQTVVNGGRTFASTVDAGLPRTRPAQVGIGAPSSSDCNEAISITSATAATPPVLTHTAHGLTSGDVVTVYGTIVGGMSGLTGTFMVHVLTANTFNLCAYDDLAGNCVSPPTTTGTYTSGGYVSRQVGRMYFRTDATAGRNSYFCTDTGGSPGWTQQFQSRRGFGAAFGSTAAGASALVADTVYFTWPTACTISAWDIDVNAGTATFDIWILATGGTAVPTITNTITASALPAISTGTHLHSTTTTGWNVASRGTLVVNAYDLIAINLKTVATATYAALSVACDPN